MANSSTSNTAALTLNLISTAGDSITLLISVISLCLIVYRLICRVYNQGRLSIEIPVILSINTLGILFGRSLIKLVDICVRTIKQDFQLTIKQNDSFVCRFRGYLLLSLMSALYWSYALQAIFRFIRVIYPEHLWLQRSKIYLCVFTPGQYLFAFTSVFPLLVIFNAIRLLPNDDFCNIFMDELFPMIYMSVVTYGLPMSAIFTCYICIIWKIRHSSLIRPYQQRNRRDRLVIRRIIIILFILNIAVVPAIIDLTMYRPRGHYSLLAYRIGSVTSSLNSVMFVVSLPFIAPQVDEPVHVSHDRRSESVLNRHRPNLPNLRYVVEATVL